MIFMELNGPITKKWVILIILGLLNISCSQMPEKPEISFLKAARQTYAQAKAHPKTAPLEALSEAKKFLDQAEQAQNKEDIKHFAYLSQKYAEIALTLVKRQAYEQESAQLAQQKEQALIDRAQQQKSSQQNAITQQLQQQLVQLKNTNIQQLVVTLDDTLFETGQADLQTGELLKLETVAAFLHQNTHFHVRVEGHTDDVGNNLYNLGLSERRATAVKFALMKRGIISKRIMVKGFGETRPVASNQTETGRQKNRRVELFIFKYH